MRKNAIRFMLNEYPDVMSIDEMCRALSIGKKTGYKLLQTGQIRFLKIGRAYRIPKINLLEYLQVISSAALSSLICKPLDLLSFG